MRDVTEVARRMMRARDAAQTARREGREEDYERAMIEARGLGWVMGVDFDLMEAPKQVSQLAESAGVELAFADQVSLWRLDYDLTAEGVDSVKPEQWWLLEVPPRDHADGSRTELWSAFLSDAQYRELCVACGKVDAERSGAIERAAEQVRLDVVEALDGSRQ